MVYINLRYFSVKKFVDTEFEGIPSDENGGC